MGINVKKLEEKILLIVCEKSQIFGSPQGISWGIIYAELQKADSFGIVDENNILNAINILIDNGYIQGIERGKDRGYSVIKITQKGKEWCRKDKLI